MPLNKPLTREEWLTYLDTTWKKCLADAWQKEWDEMSREDITRMAKEAGFVGFDGDNGSLRRFAALVAAAERNRTWTQKHWTEYERSIAAAEREACAKVCEDKTTLLAWPTYAAAIRARGQA
jgi:hypothetical protein